MNKQRKDSQQHDRDYPKVSLSWTIKYKIREYIKKKLKGVMFNLLNKMWYDPVDLNEYDGVVASLDNTHSIYLPIHKSISLQFRGQEWELKKKTRLGEDEFKITTNNHVERVLTYKDLRSFNKLLTSLVFETETLRSEPCSKSL